MTSPDTGFKFEIEHKGERIDLITHEDLGRALKHTPRTDLLVRMRRQILARLKAFEFPDGHKNQDEKNALTARIRQAKWAVRRSVAARLAALGMLVGTPALGVLGCGTAVVSTLMSGDEEGTDIAYAPDETGDTGFIMEESSETGDTGDTMTEAPVEEETPVEVEAPVEVETPIEEEITPALPYSGEWTDLEGDNMISDWSCKNNSLSTVAPGATAALAFRCENGILNAGCAFPKGEAEPKVEAYGSSNGEKPMVLEAPYNKENGIEAIVSPREVCQTHPQGTKQIAYVITANELDAE